jgi:hypothetical protein
MGILEADPMLITESYCDLPECVNPVVDATRDGNRGRVNCQMQRSWYMFGKPKRLPAAEGLDLMARKITTTVVCDLPHDGEVVSKETVSFSFDGTAYEIDVCSEHGKELHDKFSAYTDHARRAGTGGRRRRARTGPGRERSAEIRAWARERGHKVSERGRIPAH